MMIEMTPASPAPGWSTQDCDEQAGLLPGWNQRYSQLSSGPFRGALQHYRVGGIDILLERLNRVLLQRGGVDDGQLALGIPFELEGHGLLCGQLSRRDAVHVFTGRDGFEFLSPDRHLVLNLAFSSDLLYRCLPEATATRMAVQLGTPGILVPAAGLDAYREILRRILAALHGAPGLLQEPCIAAAYETTLLLGLAELLGEGERARAEPDFVLARQWMLVKAARRILERELDAPLSVGELALRLGVSRRSVQSAFQSVLGVAPASFLRSERLNRVCQSLASAPSVTEAATRWGFTHFGHFAREYRNQFGERPSDTFRRRQSRTGG